MIKTLDDLISIVVLAVVTYLTIKICLGSLINANKVTESSSIRRKIYKNYQDNEEE